MGRDTMTPHTIHARLTYARHSMADGHSPDVALLDIHDTLKGHRTMTQHTPGPWVVDYRQTIGHIKAMIDPTRQKTPTVARYDMAAPTISQAEANANARLIAAAPDLLAACRLMLDAINEHHKDGSILWVSPGETAWELLTDVIVKATGTNPANVP